ALGNDRLTPPHFALGDVIRRLRECGAANEKTHSDESSGERSRPRVLVMAPSPSRTLPAFTGLVHELQRLCCGGAPKSTRGRVRSPMQCYGDYVLGGFHIAHLFFLSL